MRLKSDTYFFGVGKTKWPFLLHLAFPFLSQSIQQCVYFNRIFTMPTNVSVKLRCDESQDGKVDPVNIQKLRIFVSPHIETLDLLL